MVESDRVVVFDLAIVFDLFCICVSGSMYLTEWQYLTDRFDWTEL